MAATSPMASLSSGLLARKGQARPAMRHAALPGFGASGHDDLGWNDMGADTATATVLVQRARLAAAIGTPAVAASVPAAIARRIRRETQQTGKASVTLRIDAERHLRLRLAAAITDRTVQDLLGEALDALLSAVPEVEALVAQLPRETRRP